MDVSDDYPLMKPVDLLKPILSSHDTDLTYEEDEDVLISWTATDANPADYDAYDNGSLIKSDSWINGSNEVNFGKLSVGIHTVTISLNDIDDNSVSFVVRVNVTTSGSNATNPLGDLGALISDNIIPIAAVTGVGAVSIFGARRVFSGKKKPKGKKPKKKKK